jgi:predicted Zn-dependent protease
MVAWAARAPGVLGWLVATQYGVLLPFSRTHETEADVIGLDLMARAGFDPRASAELWRNMARVGGESGPEWTSTHPSHASRIANLEALIPEAEGVAARARAAGRQPRCTRAP